MKRLLISSAVLFGLLAATRVAAGDLTFGERVGAQEAIDRVYYRHQVGATKSFEQAFPRATIEAQVYKYLEQTAALEAYWKTSVTGAMLDRELVRMASGTRMPDRLSELYAALGDDPVVIKECLARASLVDRMTRNFYAFDPSLHAATRRRAEELRRQLATGEVDPSSERTDRSVIELAAGDASARLPDAPGQVSKVREEADSFVLSVVLSATDRGVRAADYAVPKVTWDAWWETARKTVRGQSIASVASANTPLPVPASRGFVVGSGLCAINDTWDDEFPDGVPEPRSHHTAVWTGSVMVVWGGYDRVGLNTGGRYDPATDSWAPTSTVGAPSGRADHTAVWTGNSMIVWGGGSDTGGRYDPATDTWEPTSTVGAPSARTGHSAVWTGSSMIVWGGRDAADSVTGTGGIYDPATDSWTEISTTNAPTPREGQTAVWTGRLMVVWGGRSGDPLSSGGRFDPETNSWSPTAAAGAPKARDGHTAVWTGSSMVVWGGANGVPLDTGGRYDPSADAWMSTSTATAPSARRDHAALWTGSAMVVWGGGAKTGGRYDPAADAWSATSTVGAPSARTSQTAVWTGRSIIVWGGFDGTDVTDTGGRYAVCTRGKVIDPGATGTISAGEVSVLQPLASGTTSGSGQPLARLNVPPRVAPSADNSLDPGGTANADPVMPPISTTLNGLEWPTVTPVDSKVVYGAQGANFGYCLSGGNIGQSCRNDADCAGGTCETTFDNIVCLGYNADCSGTRYNTREYSFNDASEYNYDHLAAPGVQAFIERNWNFSTREGTLWRPFAFALDLDANSTCVGGTNPGAYCTLLDVGGVCRGGGTCTGATPTGGATWTFTPNNRNSNTALILNWPWVAVNARNGSDMYQTSGFTAFMRTSDFDPGSSTNGARIVTYLDHGNDRSGPWINGLTSVIDFNTTNPNGKVGWINAGYFDARISGATDARVISTLTGVRSEVNLISTGKKQNVTQSYGLFVQFNPTGAEITEQRHSGVYIGTPAIPGTATTIGQINGIFIDDQQFVRSGGGGTAIRIATQTASDSLEGNIRFDGGNWNNGHVQFMDDHLWRDATKGVLRYKDGAGPASEADGNAVVTGTASNLHGVVLWGVSTATDNRYDTGTEVCTAAGVGLTCVDTSEIGSPGSVGCNVPHTTFKWLAFCK